ncbi:unnamed protein product [Brassica oleracea]
MGFVSNPSTMSSFSPNNVSSCLRSIETRVLVLSRMSSKENLKRERVCIEERLLALSIISVLP